MRKPITTAVALTITAIAVWTYAAIRSDAALRTLGPGYIYFANPFGPMVVDAQIDPTELTKAARDLPVQAFNAF